MYLGWPRIHYVGQSGLNGRQTSCSRPLRAGMKGLNHHAWPPSLDNSPGNRKHQKLALGKISCIFISYVDASDTLATWLGTIFVSTMVVLLGKFDCCQKQMSKAMIFMFVSRWVIKLGQKGPEKVLTLRRLVPLAAPPPNVDGEMPQAFKALAGSQHSPKAAICTFSSEGSSALCCPLEALSYRPTCR